MLPFVPLLAKAKEPDLEITEAFLSDSCDSPIEIWNLETDRIGSFQLSVWDSEAGKWIKCDSTSDWSESDLIQATKQPKTQGR